MPVFKDHAPGTFCYIELATSDQQAAGDFYTRIFGWNRRDEDTGEFGIYTQFLHQGEVSAAMYRITPDQEKQGVRPNWAQYIAVADVDATTEQARSLGGHVVMSPMDVYDYGRLSVLADPAGAAFCLWQTKARCGVGIRNEVGTMCWNELLTTDVAKVSGFYGQLLGWSPHTSDMAGREYTVAYNDGLATAGMMAVSPDLGDTPAQWLTYFAVDDCDGTAETTVGLGGRVVVAPRDLPNVGRFAVLADPQNALFGVVRMLSR